MPCTKELLNRCRVLLLASLATPFGLACRSPSPDISDGSSADSAALDGGPADAAAPDATVPDSSLRSDAAVDSGPAIPLPTGDFVPILGIPTPTIGIAEPPPEAPSRWPEAAVDGFYYVDMSSPEATDVDNPFGSPARPRATFPPARRFPAGTVIELHGGVYDDISWFGCDGTESAPCFIRGASADEMPVISTYIQLRDSTYTIIENIDFAGGSSGAVSVWGASHHVAIRDNVVRDKTYVSNTSAFGTSPQDGDHLHDVVFYRNAISNLGDWTVTDTDPDFHGVAPSTHGRDAASGAEADHIWVIDNTCYHLSGNCVQVNAGRGAGAILHHVYVGRNISRENRQAGFWCKQATDVIFSQNVASGGRVHGSQPGDGAGFQYNPDYLWFIFNELGDNTFGIRQSDTTGGNPDHQVFIIGNFIHDNYAGSDQLHWGSPTGWAITLWQGNQTRHIIDNSLVNNRGGIELIHEGLTDIRGNVVATTYAETPLLSVTRTATSEMTMLGINLWYAGETHGSYQWAGSRVLSGLTALQATSGQCSGCLEADPMFTDSTSGDYSLAAGSPGRDVSTRSDVYATFFERYGLSIEVDREGEGRPASGGWDLGAWEH